jgi:hypothetical protein
MINLTSPCCGVTAKYADANSSKYGCAGCGSGFTIEQAKAATDAAGERSCGVKRSRRRRSSMFRKPRNWRERSADADAPLLPICRSRRAADSPAAQ